MSHQGCRPIFTKVCRVPNITAEAIREEAGPNLRRRAKGRKCHLEQLYRQNHGAAPAETRGAKNYRNLLASVGLARCSWTGGEADKQLRTVRAKCVGWNWKIGSKHHIPSLGRATGSHPIQGRVDTGQVVAAAATKLLESFHDDARGFRKLWMFLPILVPTVILNAEACNLPPNIQKKVSVIPSPPSSHRLTKF